MLVTFAGRDHESTGEMTRVVMARVQHDGTCWAGGAAWQGHDAMRISVSNWSTTAADIDRSAEAILGCYRDARAALGS